MDWSAYLARGLSSKRKQRSRGGGTAALEWRNKKHKGGVQRQHGVEVAALVERARAVKERASKRQPFDDAELDEAVDGPPVPFRICLLVSVSRAF